MHSVIIRYLNLALLGLCLFFAVAAAFVWLIRPGTIEEKQPKIEVPTPPKNVFHQSEEKTSGMGETCFQCQFHPPTIKIPDLKNILIFYGKNGRPDADQEKPQLHFNLPGNKQLATLTPGEKLYLVFTRKTEGSKYAFSPSNDETPLWIEAELSGQEALITVHLMDENGEEVMEPAINREFVLNEKEFVRNVSQPWEMGKWRVDATLLARMRARWFGIDKFLEEHGGDEFKHTIGRQRIDFGEGEDVYSVFVSANDTLVFSKERWKKVEPGEDSLNQPLMVVKKIDDRLMNLELWDVQGKAKVALNLLRSSDNFTHDSFGDTFKFLGARTRTQFLFEIDEERMVIRPQDWLIMTEEGWKKLATVEEIDNFVNRKLVGTLFVFDKIVRKDDKQLIQATVYNQNRTESYPVEIAMQPNSLPSAKKDNALQAPNPEAVTRKVEIEPPSYAKHK